jgi:hypothetical protein
MTRPGGLIVHVCAATGFFGRGYYDVHPLLFDDFYAANGCELIASSVRPRYRPRGILASVSHRLRLRDRVSERRSGDVYVTKSRLNRIELGPSLPAEGEPLFLPNNVLGTYCFKKGEDRPVQMPIRTAPYAEEEVGRADA